MWRLGLSQWVRFVFEKRLKLTYVKKTGVTDDVINRDKTEYSSYKLAEVLDEENRNLKILGQKIQNW